MEPGSRPASVPGARARALVPLPGHLPSLWGHPVPLAARDLLTPLAVCPLCTCHLGPELPLPLPLQAGPPPSLTSSGLSTKFASLLLPPSVPLCRLHTCHLNSAHPLTTLPPVSLFKSSSSHHPPPPPRDYPPHYPLHLPHSARPPSSPIHTPLLSLQLSPWLYSSFSPQPQARLLLPLTSEPPPPQLCSGIPPGACPAHCSLSLAIPFLPAQPSEHLPSAPSHSIPAGPVSPGLSHTPASFPVLIYPLFLPVLLSRPPGLGHLDPVHCFLPPQVP